MSTLDELRKELAEYKKEISYKAPETTLNRALSIAIESCEHRIAERKWNLRDLITYGEWNGSGEGPSEESALAELARHNQEAKR